MQIVEPADVVDDGEGGDVVRERVDREVAPERVLFRRAECIVVMDEMFAFRRRRIGRGDAVLHDFLARCDLPAECRDLDDLLPEFHVRQTEPPSDNPAVPEQLLDLIGVRRGADVEVFGPTPKQEIADAAADKIRGVFVLP